MVRSSISAVTSPGLRSERLYSLLTIARRQYFESAHLKHLAGNTGDGGFGIDDEDGTAPRQDDWSTIAAGVGTL